MVLVKILKFFHVFLNIFGMISQQNVFDIFSGK